MNQTQIVSALQEMPLFLGLDEPALQEMAALLRPRTYPAQTALFHAGDPGHLLYVVVAGRVRIEKVSAGGETIHLAYRGRADYFGELALLDDKPRMASATTVSECLCLTMDREAFRRCLSDTPSMASHVVRTLAERLREAAGALEAVQGLDVLGRLCQALLEVASDGAPRRVTHQQLADRIGATRESVTRALSSLRKTGLVRTEGSRLTLLDPESLRRRCET